MMKAGPELDALVAERVLGCKPRPTDKPWAVGLGFAQCECGDPENWDYPHGRTTQRGIHGEILPYSTDLTTCAAAAEEAIRAGKVAAWTIQRANDGQVGALVYLSPVTDGLSGVLGETPAHALALALLKAVGHE